MTPRSPTKTLGGSRGKILNDFAFPVAFLIFLYNRIDENCEDINLSEIFSSRELRKLTKVIKVNTREESNE